MHVFFFACAKSKTISYSIIIMYYNYFGKQVNFDMREYNNTYGKSVISLHNLELLTICSNSQV